VKLLLALSLLPFLGFSQSDTIRLVKSYNYHPKISNIQIGEIDYWKLCDTSGIQTNENCTVFSFQMSYFGKNGFTEKRIIGNQIPDSICLQIGVYGLHNMIFFTNIQALNHENNKIIRLTPFNLTPIKRED